DGNSIENGPEHSTLVYASLKNLTPAKALQSLIYDHYEQGTRVYQNINGDFATMPASADGTDQSKISLKRAKEQVARQRPSSSSSSSQDDVVLLPGSDDLPLSPRESSPAGQAEAARSTAAEVSEAPTSPESTGGPQGPPAMTQLSNSRAPRSSSTRHADTTLVFGRPIPQGVVPGIGWVVVSTDSSSYQGLASIEDSSSPDMLALRPLCLPSGPSGMLSVLDSEDLHRVAKA
ncbi:hypothetical protein FOZ63_013815, partial [Perkinsus olseni]